MGGVSLYSGCFPNTEVYQIQRIPYHFSDQSRGIARKLMTEEQLLKVHEQMQCVLKWHNGSFDKIFFCPHDIDDNCTCRKPKPGLLTMAEQYYKIDKTQSYIVSGSASNLEAGRRYGIKTIRVGSWDATADYSVGKLADILNIVV